MRRVATMLSWVLLFIASPSPLVAQPPPRDGRWRVTPHTHASNGSDHPITAVKRVSGKGRSTWRKNSGTESIRRWIEEALRCHVCNCIGSGGVHGGARPKLIGRWRYSGYSGMPRIKEIWPSVCAIYIYSRLRARNFPQAFPLYPGEPRPSYKLSTFFQYSFHSP